MTERSRGPALPQLTLVLGGARSGKSRHAEAVIESAIERGELERGIYVATAEPGDDEMRRRIAEHRSRRGSRWQTVEEPLELAATLARVARPRSGVLVDCLTLWLSNVMRDRRDVEAEMAALAAGLRRSVGPVVLVANEVGLGIVPDNPLARDFRDRAGQLNQTVAQLADRVLFVAAGLPITLKDRDR